MISACDPKLLVDYSAGLELVFNLSPDLLCLFSADGCFVKANDAFKEALGYTHEELVSKSYLCMVHPGDTNRSIAAFDAVNRNENVSLFRNRFRCANGQYKWLSWNANQLPDGTVYASARDISEIIRSTKIKEQAEEKLRLSNERFQLATAATKDVIWDWDFRTNKLKWSKSFSTNFGYTFDMESQPPNTWEDNIHPEDLRRVITGINAAIDDVDTQFWRDEYRYIRADKSVAFIIDQGYIIRNEDGKAIRMVGAMQDITELKEKELRIIKQNEQLTEIAQINSHELRRPVASILGLMQLVLKENVKEQSTRELLDLLEATTHELDQVIRRIIDKTHD